MPGMRAPGLHLSDDSRPHIVTGHRSYAFRPEPRLLAGPLLQAAVNFSDGRRSEVFETIVNAIASVVGATLADASADVDHNRMVATILGPPDAVSAAVAAAARIAVAEIDLRSHTGVHPRAGAIDVIPLTPIRRVEWSECVALSHEIARRLASELNIPVYLYERSAAAGRRAALPDIRKGGFEGLASEPLTGDRRPDYGPPAAHPAAGVVIVGARDSLVAYNVNLETSNIAVVRQIAGWIRRERDRLPELKGVRALGLPLPTAGMCQISMNLTQTAQSPLPAVFDVIVEQALKLGVSVRESEVIGLIPIASLAGELPARIRWTDYHPCQILENWMGAGGASLPEAHA